MNMRDWMMFLAGTELRSIAPRSGIPSFRGSMIAWVGAICAGLLATNGCSDDATQSTQGGPETLDCASSGDSEGCSAGGDTAQLTGTATSQHSGSAGHEGTASTTAASGTTANTTSPGDATDDASETSGTAEGGSSETGMEASTTDGDTETGNTTGATSDGDSSDDDTETGNTSEATSDGDSSDDDPTTDSGTTGELPCQAFAIADCPDRCIVPEAYRLDLDAACRHEAAPTHCDERNCGDTEIAYLVHPETGDHYYFTDLCVPDGWIRVEGTPPIEAAAFGPFCP